MDLDKLNVKLKELVDEYIDFDGEEICLDGWYTLDDLKEMVKTIEENK